MKNPRERDRLCRHVILTAKPTQENSFAFTSPYGGCWLEHYYRLGAMDLFAKKVVTEAHFRQLLSQISMRPELVIMGNFVVERHGIQSVCRDLRIDWVCSEDGFFPHYTTLHADPLGFAWESSLCKMTFRAISAAQSLRARRCREKWLQFERTELPPGVQAPYVLWPLQLVGDRVNQWDLKLSNWSDLIAHFRQSLPPEYQLVLKSHPRGKQMDERELAISELPHTILIREKCSLPSLIESAAAVAGANSTVLLESRLMFHKPVYSYARGWHTNHTALFMPIHFGYPPRELNRLDYLEDGTLLRDDWLDDYTDWFLYQLLIRQLDRDSANNFGRLREWTKQRTHQAFVKFGEDIFQ